MPDKFAIPITLTNAYDPTDVRYLTLTGGEALQIGRSSKIESKNLLPSPTNALFDCPVVSREHAVLEAHAWASKDDEVTITDIGSTHRTYVNGQSIVKDIPVSLKSGDRIRFGGSIPTSNGLHNGICVTFHKTSPSKTLENVAVRNTSGVFRCPNYDDSDSELDEVNSSEGETKDATSSAITTPEQAKPLQGSAAKPIDVDTFTVHKHPTVIDIDDEEVYVPESASMPTFKSLRLVQAGLPQQTKEPVNHHPEESILVPQSIGHAVSPPEAEPLKIIHESNDGAFQGFHRPADSDKRLFQFEDQHGEHVIHATMQHGGDPNAAELDDFAETSIHEASEDEMLDAYNPYKIPFEDDEPHTYSIQRQISPELESLPISQMHEHAQRIHPDEPSHVYPPYESPAVAEHHGWEYTSAPPMLPPKFAPPSGSQPPSFSLPPFTARPMPWSPPDVPFSPHLSSQSAFAGREPLHGGAAALHIPAFGFYQNSISQDAKRDKKSQTSRIAIPELVDAITDEPQPEPPHSTSRSAAYASAQSQVIQGDIVEPVSHSNLQPVIMNVSSNGKKRKADQMSVATNTEASHDTQDVIRHTIDKVSQEPAAQAVTDWRRKKLKTRHQPSLAKRMLKYAAVTALGSALGSFATLAFLYSEAADRYFPEP